MSLRPDSWIRARAREGMIDPFEERQVREGTISYGLSSYGYDIRIADEYKIFTNVNSTMIDPRVVFGIALQTASSAIVVAHNHPSGSLDPSEHDRQITEQLKDAGRLLRITVLDHLILTREGAFSLAANCRV